MLAVQRINLSQNFKASNNKQNRPAIMKSKADTVSFGMTIPISEEDLGFATKYLKEITGSTFEKINPSELSSEKFFDTNVISSILKNFNKDRAMSKIMISCIDSPKNIGLFSQATYEQGIYNRICVTPDYTKYKFNPATKKAETPLKVLFLSEYPLEDGLFSSKMREFLAKNFTESNKILVNCNKDVFLLEKKPSISIPKDSIEPFRLLVKKFKNSNSAE